MVELITELPDSLGYFARGGGGGSGGGGGGGGGLALIGYVPAYYVTSFAHRHVQANIAAAAGVMVGITIAILVSLFHVGLAVVIGFAAVLGVYSGMKGLHARIGYQARKYARRHMRLAASKDPVWHEPAVQARIAEVFSKFQTDWSTFNFERMKSYLSPRYYQHVALILRALQQMDRRNEVASPTLLEHYVIEANDYDEDDHDHFVVFIRAGANDQLIDMRSSSIIYTDNSVFQELWHFDRQEDEWVLDGIDQATANVKSKNHGLEKFARQYGLYYSLDWGWLLLPRRGQLFNKASFKTSDVNNHVIGEWNETLIQLYTYVPNVKNLYAQNHLVAQINLPKSYGGIIIRRKSLWNTPLFSKLKMKRHGYQQVSFEWPDFNKRYEVFATDTDKVTSFELLNPAFMAELYDYDLPVSIEVVDNIVYLYCLNSAPLLSYELMMKILQRCLRELKR